MDELVSDSAQPFVLGKPLRFRRKAGTQLIEGSPEFVLRLNAVQQPVDIGDRPLDMTWGADGHELVYGLMPSAIHEVQETFVEVPLHKDLQIPVVTERVGLQRPEGSTRRVAFRKETRDLVFIQECP